MDGKEGMLIFREKQARLIMALADSSKEWYLSDLAKNTGVTYIHASRFISRCEKSGIAASEKHGKIKRIFLTEKGRQIAEGIRGIISKIEDKSAGTEQASQQQSQAA